jgi:hypothetical protein
VKEDLKWSETTEVAVVARVETIVADRAQKVFGRMEKGGTTKERSPISLPLYIVLFFHVSTR